MIEVPDWGIPEDHTGDESSRDEELCNAWISEDDVATIERLCEGTIRAGSYKTAIAGYALALRLRNETGFHPLRRESDESVT